MATRIDEILAETVTSLETMCQALNLVVKALEDLNRDSEDKPG